MRKMIKQKSVIFLTFLLGIIISIHIKSLNPNNTFVSLKSIKEMGNQITIERIEIENINKLILQRKSDIVKYEIELKENGSINNVVENELKDLETITGFKELKGEGIIVELRDSEIEIKEGQDPNLVLVHDVDVLNVVNDLKVAGAEALAINGERIINLSEIKCAGPTITINGSTYGQPFIITAIGNKKFLQSAIEAPNTTAYILKEAYDINVKSSIMDELTIPEYDKNIEFKYIKEGD